ncbi:unnamed protein product, partial [Ectocarpus sp. 12 AP-2014]
RRSGRETHQPLPPATPSRQQHGRLPRCCSAAVPPRSPGLWPSQTKPSPDVVGRGSLLPPPPHYGKSDDVLLQEAAGSCYVAWTWVPLCFGGSGGGGDLHPDRISGRTPMLLLYPRQPSPHVLCRGAM